MKKSFFRGGMLGLVAAGLMTFGFIGLADAQKGPCSSNKKCKGDPSDVATLGSMKLKGTTVSSMKGRVYAHWADNPDREILFGIQYWNTSVPAETGDPLGRSSDDRNVALPDPLFACCAWGYQGGEELNNTYAGWYNPQTTVRLRVKSASLMKKITQASQKFVAMEVKLDGATITGFNVLRGSENYHVK